MIREAGIHLIFFMRAAGSHFQDLFRKSGFAQALNQMVSICRRLTRRVGFHAGLGIAGCQFSQTRQSRQRLLLERINCGSVTTTTIEGPSHKMGSRIGFQWVKTEGLFHPFNGFFMAAQPCQDFALLRDNA